MNLSPEQAIGDIKERLRAAKGYASVEILAVLVRTPGPDWIPWSVLLRGPSHSSSDETVEYGDIRFVRKVVPKSDLARSLDEWLTQKTLKLDDFSVTLPVPTDQTFVESDQSWNSFKFEWPTTVFNSPDTGASKVPQGPISTRDSPFYENIYQAVQDFFGMNAYGGISYATIVALSDLTAKIESVRVEGKAATVSIDRHSEAPSDLYLKMNWVIQKTGNQHFGRPMEFPRNQKVQVINLEEDVSNLTIVLTESQGRLIDRAAGYFASSHPQKVKWVTAEEDLERLIQSGEDEGVEFKTGIKFKASARPSQIEKQRVRNDFLETLSSFSNKKGGIIILGIDKDNNVIGDETDTPESIRGLCDRWAVPRIDIGVDPIIHKGKRLLIVRVPEGPNKPYAAIDVTNGKDHRFYIRSSSKDFMMSREDFDEIYSKRSGPVGLSWR